MHLMHSTYTIVCITHAYHAFHTFFWTNFAPIMSHKISLISCDNRIKMQNIVWIQKKDIPEGWSHASGTSNWLENQSNDS